MAEPQLSPSQHITTYTIKSNGSVVQDTVLINSIVITTEIDLESEAIIVIGDINQDQKLQITDYSEFSLDAHIEIEVGYDHDHSVLFKGKVTQKKVILNSQSGSFLKITCKYFHDKGDVIPEDTKEKTPLELTYGHNILESELYTNSPDSLHINGSLKFQGSSKAHVTDYIKLKGFEDVFPKSKSDLYISQVSHVVEDGNWITTVTVGK